MQSMKRALVLWLGMVWLLGCKSESTTVGSAVKVDVFDMTGREVNPFENRAAKGTVFFFVRTDCPISNRYAPEIERLASQYSKEGISFWLVYPDEATSPQEIEQHRKEYHLNLHALRDPRHALVKMAKVTITPEAAVFLKDGHEVYHGRIDDRYVDFGKERPTPTTHDLEDALKSLAGGRPIMNSGTRAVGCYIE
jgi:peroxiredoxin